ncbi:MAG: bifunctional adenosylcobinamide kinase/adenosylcobinamide-phosphate guanylyltransferase [Alphaproteobacteria bacterium]|nr:bifunctional adenosylcobinamide kinase/adenosylcobinamide-phosphate guanylyltransferase [Alphaproteobacteria bacterium]
MTRTLPHLTLVLGGQRSGKSVHAESLFPRGSRALYIATAEAGDAEMAERIAQHKSRRGKDWKTIEEPLDIARTVAAAPQPVLVECLSLWVANLIAARRDLLTETDVLLAALAERKAPTVVVSVEAGLGVVPDNALARRWLDALGLVNQKIAAHAARVVLVAAGLPLVLKEKK